MYVTYMVTLGEAIKYWVDSELWDPYTSHLEPITHKDTNEFRINISDDYEFIISIYTDGDSIKAYPLYRPVQGTTVRILRFDAHDPELFDKLRSFLKEHLKSDNV